MSDAPKPYGYCATLLVGDKSMVGQPIGKPTIKVIHRKGPRSACERAAKLTRKLISIESIEPCTEEQYIRAFGEGRM